MSIYSIVCIAASRLTNPGFAPIVRWDWGTGVIVDPKMTPCAQCPLQNCRGLRPLERDHTAFMQEYKSGEMRIERGGSALEQGKASPYLFTVLEGVLLRYRTLEEGRRQIVNFMFPGDLIGLQGAFDESSSHGVEALLPAKLCIFPRAKFIELMREHPRLSYDVVWLCAKEETQLEEHIVALGQRSAKERVAYLAVWLLDRALATGVAGEDNHLALPITQAQIADVLGLSLVHTNRTLRALQREGLVNWRPGEICIPDMDRAGQFAHYDPVRDSKRPFI